jgi:hypothetical protein
MNAKGPSDRRQVRRAAAGFNQSLQRTAAPQGSRTVRVIWQRLLQPTGRFRRRSLSLVVRRRLTMKKKMLIFLFPAVIVAVGFLLLRRDPVSKSVKVTFLFYTNCDAQGGNGWYTWAWFRIDNRSPFRLGCYQGPLDVQRAGKWFQDTNTLGRRHFDAQTSPGESATIAMVVPENARRWRSSFLFTREDVDTINRMIRKSRFETFMDNLHLERFGLRNQPWRRKPEPTIVTSETIDL